MTNAPSPVSRHDAPPEAGRNTNWKGLVGIGIALGLPFAVQALPSFGSTPAILKVVVPAVFGVCLLSGVGAGLLMLRDIRGGARSSKALAIVAIVWSSLAFAGYLITVGYALWTDYTISLMTGY